MTGAQDTSSGLRLQERPIHLGLGATAEPQPAFPSGDAAMEWYAQYAARNAGDGAEGRLVSMYRFTEDWSGLGDASQWR